jgi:hypothetical protein
VLAVSVFACSAYMELLMGTQPIYALPLRWKPDNPAQNENDRRWLESIVRNAAPFSDWWAKARIVQLAYAPPTLPPGKRQPKVGGIQIYQGLDEFQIVQLLQQCCNSEDHPEFVRQIDEEFVIQTLNAWKSYRFTQAISCNFDVYAHRQYRNVFLVVSTAPVSLNVDRVLPSTDRFRPLFNVDELAQIMHGQSVNRLSLRTHGYANPAKTFYDFFDQEATALNQPMGESSRTLRDDHFYIGYHWPSEQPFTSPGLWADYLRPLGIVFKFLFVLSAIAGVIGSLLFLLLQFAIVPLLRVVGQLLPSLGRLGTAWNLTTQWRSRCRVIGSSPRCLCFGCWHFFCCERWYISAIAIGLSTMVRPIWQNFSGVSMTVCANLELHPPRSPPPDLAKPFDGLPSI